MTSQPTFEIQHSYEARRMKLDRFTVQAVVAVVLASTSLGAQGAPKPVAPPMLNGRIPVTINVIDGSPTGRLAQLGNGTFILRAKGAVGSDIIVMTSDQATPDHLAAAAVTLTAAMERDGDLAPSDRILRIAQQEVGPPSETRAALIFLDRLTLVPEVQIPGFGRGRSAILYVPSAQLRAALAKSGKMKFRVSNP